MTKPDTLLKIHTLGRFSLALDGKAIADVWPDETTRILFCSLLSPLDIYFTWDRVCRSLLGVPATPANRHHLLEHTIRPLNSFLINELGFAPVVAGKEYLRIDPLRTAVDAHEFYGSVVEGLRLTLLGNVADAYKSFNRADQLYAGSYLPGIPGKIIENCRTELESLYRTAVMEGLTHGERADGTQRR